MTHYLRTEVRFASFLSGEFITVIVVNPPERKLAKCTSVDWLKLKWISSKVLTAIPSIYKEVHEPGLEWSMTWPALDPYGQKVIGRTLANIKVGYQFRCGYSCGV